MRKRNAKARRWTRSLRPAAGINLTSMMDILTTLLLFLLKSYVVEGEAMVPPPGVELPHSTAAESPENSVIVAIDGDAILVDSERIASVAEAEASPGLTIPSLAARLDEMRTQQDQIQSMQGADESPHIATIQGHRTIEYRVLRKVMYTLNQSGFEHVSLAVLQNS